MNRSCSPLERSSAATQPAGGPDSQFHRVRARRCQSRAAPLWNRVQEQDGLSLVEELVSLAVISLGLVVLIGMLSTSTAGIQAENNLVFGENLARTQLEIIKHAAYEPDPLSNPYPSAPAPAPYSINTTVEYWIAPSGPFTSTVRDDGLQRITVTVSRNGADIFQLQGYKADR